MGAFLTVVFILLFIVFLIAFVFLVSLFSAIIQMGPGRHLELHLEDDDEDGDDGIIYEDDE